MCVFVSVFVCSYLCVSFTTLLFTYLVYVENLIILPYILSSLFWFIHAFQILFFLLSSLHYWEEPRNTIKVTENRKISLIFNMLTVVAYKPTTTKSETLV